LSDDKDKSAVMMIACTKEDIEILLTSSEGTTGMKSYTFIADSGASTHMRNSTQGMYDLEDHTKAVTIDNSDSMYSKYKGKFKGTIIQQDGQYRDQILEDVLFIPDLWVNLLSNHKTRLNIRRFLHKDNFNGEITLSL
jgi:hypothetical protein